MSELVNGISTLSFLFVDPRIEKHIRIATTDPIPIEICEAMTLVLRAVADQLEYERRPIGNLPVNCVFSNTDSFSVKLSPTEHAVCMRIAFYPLGEISPFIGQDILFTILTEELCHLIWDISDEIAVNFKVLSVLRHLNADLQLSDLYGSEAEKACLRYLEDHPTFQA